MNDYSDLAYELLHKYYRSERVRINEFSGSIRKDLFYLAVECREIAEQLKRDISIFQGDIDDYIQSEDN